MGARSRNRAEWLGRSPECRFRGRNRRRLKPQTYQDGLRRPAGGFPKTKRNKLKLNLSLHRKERGRQTERDLWVCNDGRSLVGHVTCVFVHWIISE